MLQPGLVINSTFFNFREEKIKTMVDDIMEKLPDPFNMIEIMGKVEERTPYVIVAFQVNSKKNFS
jgi:dynein heavy chain